MKYMQSQQSMETSAELDDREVTTNGGQRSDLWAGKLHISV